MEAAVTAPVAKHYTLVFVQPGKDYGWLVALAGSGHSHFFADRSLALTYAKAWASANRPSKVCVNGAGEGLEHEWIFR